MDELYRRATHHELAKAWIDHRIDAATVLVVPVVSVAIIDYEAAWDVFTSLPLLDMNREDIKTVVDAALRSNDG